MAESRVRRPSSDMSDYYKVKWEKRREAPITAPCSAVSIEERVYVADHLDNVYEYNITTGQWLNLPPCGVNKFSLANIRGSLTAIGSQYHFGGHVESAPADCFCWDEVSMLWVERYPPTPTTYSFPAVATTADHVVVAGVLDGFVSVHVMDISTCQWSSVASLPVSSYVLSVAVCNGTVYVAADEYPRYRLYWCSLDVLLSSTSTPNQWLWMNGPQLCKPFSLVTVNNVLLWLDNQSEGLTIFLYEEVHAEFTKLVSSTTKLYGYGFCATVLPGERILVMDDATVLVGELLSISAGNEGSVLFIILVQASLNSLSIMWKVTCTYSGSQ